MSDQIYRQAAIDAVTSLCDDCDSGYCGDCRVNIFVEGGKHVRKVLEDLSPAQPEPQWIPCSERLPEVDEELESADVLITYKNTYWTGATTTNIAIARYGEKLLSSDGKYLDTPGWVGSKKYSVDDVLAWMPLPAPYKTGMKEK
jgi:hypothetical protein